MTDTIEDTEVEWEGASPWLQDRALAALRLAIKNPGQYTIQPVHPHDEDGIPYVYTVGLGFKGLPEFLIAGTYDDAAQSVLNIVVSNAWAGGAPSLFAQIGSVQELRDDQGDILVKYVLVPGHMSNAGDKLALLETVHGGTSTSVWQILFADGDGNWPWQDGILPDVWSFDDYAIVAPEGYQPPAV